MNLEDIEKMIVKARKVIKDDLFVSINTIEEVDHNGEKFEYVELLCHKGDGSLSRFFMEKSGMFFWDNNYKPKWGPKWDKRESAGFMPWMEAKIE